MEIGPCLKIVTRDALSGLWRKRAFNNWLLAQSQGRPTTQTLQEEMNMAYRAKTKTQAAVRRVLRRNKGGKKT